MDYRNAIQLADGGFDCEVNHETYGWIPFTANAGDESGGELHARIFAAGDAAPYVPPSEAEVLTKWRAGAHCSPLQGQLALGETHWNTVEAYLSDPTTPWSIRRVINSASVWNRSSENIDTLAWVVGLSETEVDDLFKLAVTINA